LKLEQLESLVIIKSNHFLRENINSA